MTSQKQTLEPTEEQLTLFQVGSLNLANHTAPQESGLEKMTNATYGQRCLEQFERFNHVGSWAKMFSALLIGTGGWYSRRCRLTWNMKGTKSNRLYFRLRVSTLPTEGTEFGLLPTVRARAAGGNCSNDRGKGNLEDVIASGMLPTPMAEWSPEKNTGKRNQDSIPKRIKDAGGKTSQLNPRFVLEMMGFPPNWTELPFQSGETNQSKPQETP